jgi:hypothetical protein
MTQQAIDAAQQAIQHTPSLPDCYIALAHAYKRAGSFEKAAEALRSARGLDGQDRFLNSKCAKYILQSIGSPNQPARVRTRLLKESRELIGLFTRKDAPDPVSDMVDMQAAWYVMAEAKVALRVSDWGLGLKRLHQVYEVRSFSLTQSLLITFCPTDFVSRCGSDFSSMGRGPVRLSYILHPKKHIPKLSRVEFFLDKFYPIHFCFLFWLTIDTCFVYLVC